MKTWRGVTMAMGLAGGLWMCGAGAPSGRAAVMELVAGGGDTPPTGVPATTVQLKEPFGIGFDNQANLFLIEMAEGNRLLKIDTQGRVFHLAGTGIAGDAGDGGPGIEAQFNGPHNLAVTPEGDVLISDTWNGRIRHFDPRTERVTSLSEWQVPPDQARRSGPYCVTLDFTGTRLYIADLRRVHRLDLANGKAEVVAGNGEKGVPKDGALAAEAPLVDPRAASVDRRGTVYILERGGHALRAVDSSGRIRTVVNASGAKGASGDDGSALAATMNGPKHLCVDLEDNVIIADAENHLIRKYVAATGTMERVAGTGRRGAGGVGGPPERCELARPHGVAVHPVTGELYIVDSYNNRVLKIRVKDRTASRPR